MNRRRIKNVINNKCCMNKVMMEIVIFYDMPLNLNEYNEREKSASLTINISYL